MNTRGVPHCRDEEDHHTCNRSNESTNWRGVAGQYHQLRMERARSKGKLTHPYDEANYLVMGLSSAVGDINRHAKRLFSGDSDADHRRFESAMASARIYLQALADLGGKNLDALCSKHMDEVMNRMDGK